MTVETNNNKTTSQGAESAGHPEPLYGVPKGIWDRVVTLVYDCCPLAGIEGQTVGRCDDVGAVARELLEDIGRAGCVAQVEAGPAGGQLDRLSHADRVYLKSMLETARQYPAPAGTLSRRLFDIIERLFDLDGAGELVEHANPLPRPVDVAGVKKAADWLDVHAEGYTADYDCSPALIGDVLRSCARHLREHAGLIAAVRP